MDLSERRETFNGFGEALARAIEFVATPLVFAGLGHLADRWLGLAPLLTVAFLVFALVGTFVRTWYGYEAEMRAHEAAAPWRRASPAERG